MVIGRVSCQIVDAVATAVRDNPAEPNAMTTDMWNALPPLHDELAAGSNVRVVVVTGTGDTFCAGAGVSTRTAFAQRRAPALLWRPGQTASAADPARS